MDHQPDAVGVGAALRGLRSIPVSPLVTVLC